MYHALALLAVGILAERVKHKSIAFAGQCFVVGTLMFSGALYVTALSEVRGFGMAAPFGGAVLILGWTSLAIAAPWRRQ
jgi:uncharacterized membrane protein YgdD (TMEM256/DUF423 family)